MSLSVLLQLFHFPNQAWLHISMDFIEQLPKLGNKDTVMVVVDRLTKYGHFITPMHPFTAVKIAQLYINNIHKLHGIPKVMVFSPDKIFTSLVQKELMRLIGTSLHYGSSYDPVSALASLSFGYFTHHPTSENMASMPFWEVKALLRLRCSYGLVFFEQVNTNYLLQGSSSTMHFKKLEFRANLLHCNLAWRLSPQPFGFLCEMGSVPLNLKFLSPLLCVGVE